LRPSTFIEDKLEAWRRRPRLDEVRDGVGLGPPHQVDLQLAVDDFLADDAVGAARAFLMFLGRGLPAGRPGARHCGCPFYFAARSSFLAARSSDGP